MQYDLAIIGGGPAGLMAAICAAGRGRRVVLLEKNRRPGVKILMAGGTRCNLTHATDARGIVAAFGLQGRFLHSALAALGPQAVVEFFAARGVSTYVEPGGKVFPKSDRATDVLDALVTAVRAAGGTIAGQEPVQKIAPLVGPEPDSTGFAISTSNRRWTAGKVLLSTGGCSYPACGTSGDGYALAEAMGHTIVAPQTALVPLVSHARWVTELQGVTLPDVGVRLVGSQPVRPRAMHAGRSASRGALLFTHFGVSGPAAMNVSRELNRQPGPWTLECDFLPERPLEEVDGWLAEACRTAGGRQASTLLAQRLPHRLTDALVQETLGGDGRAAELSKEHRRALAAVIKAARIPIAGTLGFKKAEVTAGGVTLGEVDSRTMQSKLVPGLYFAGELLDLDGPIGGFNFQAAFSTGWLAGQNV